MLCIGLVTGCDIKNTASATGGVKSAAVNLTVDTGLDDQNPAFSPTGLNLLFSSKRNGAVDNFNIWKMNIDGTGPIALTSDLALDNVNMPGSSWNGVINKICFSSDRSGNDEIWTMKPDGTNLQQVTTNPAQDWEPTFSPDGSWIVFQSDRTGNWEIFKINIITLTLIQLTNNPADDWEPNWSPMGDKIVFQSNRDGNWEIYTMNADGTNQLNITFDPEEDTDPSWSPDGSSIVYSSTHGGLIEADVFIIKPGGPSAPARVTTHPAYDGAPSYSPAGNKIVFESDRSGNLDIWIIDTPVTVEFYSRSGLLLVLTLLGSIFIIMVIMIEQ